MGKLDNIKRARRLKEAKRKREMDAAIEAGTSPAGLALQKRVALSGNKLVKNDAGVKYSELLQEFVLPVLSRDDNSEIVKIKFALGVRAWNAAILKGKNRELYQKSKKSFISLSPDMSKMKELFDYMVQLKQEKFSAYTNIIADFEVKQIKGIDYELSVGTLPLNEL